MRPQPHAGMKPVVNWFDGTEVISAGTSWATISHGERGRLPLARGAGECAALADALQQLAPGGRRPLGSLLLQMTPNGEVVTVLSPNDSFMLYSQVVTDLLHWLCFCQGRPLPSHDDFDRLEVADGRVTGLGVCHVVPDAAQTGRQLLAAVEAELCNADHLPAIGASSYLSWRSHWGFSFYAADLPEEPLHLCRSSLARLAMAISHTSYAEP